MSVLRPSSSDMPWSDVSKSRETILCIAWIVAVADRLVVADGLLLLLLIMLGGSSALWLLLDVDDMEDDCEDDDVDRVVACMGDRY